MITASLAIAFEGPIVSGKGNDIHKGRCGLKGVMKENSCARTGKLPFATVKTRPEEHR